MLHAGSANIVGFEPNAEALAELQAMRGPNEIYLPHAVGDGCLHTLRFCRAAGMTSLLEPNPAVLGLFHGFPDWGTVTGTTIVQTVRLDDIAETKGADLIKLDIQGAELMVLQHAAQRLADAVIVQAEVEFLPLYLDQPLFGDVDRLLRQHGFMLHRFFPDVSRVVRPLCINNDPYAGLSQLVWADAIFIRDITCLDRLSDRQLLAMAAILHDCYGSVDVVLHLLGEHDRRQVTSLGPAYLRHLQARVGADAATPNGRPPPLEREKTDPRRHTRREPFA
jgi:FkbM family methyltransferase